jgi:hypothetical protein
VITAGEKVAPQVLDGLTEMHASGVCGGLLIDTLKTTGTLTYVAVSLDVIVTVSFARMSIVRVEIRLWD